MRKLMQLIKPGIIFGNLLTAAAGFCLGKGESGFWAMMGGLGLVMAAACVCNNYIDREIDQKMERTKGRPVISFEMMIILAAALGGNGFFLLAAFTNSLTLFAAFVGFVGYVGVYSLMKYKTDFSTLIGSVAGAAPPVVGYFAAANALDMNASLLFLTLVLWQMPHFYSIALYRMSEYAMAGVPVLPITQGVYRTKLQSSLYIVAFSAVASIVTPWALIPSALWFALSLKGFKTGNDTKWARQMFLCSLITIIGFSLCLIVQRFAM